MMKLQTDTFTDYFKKYRNAVLTILALLVSILGTKASEQSSIYILNHFTHRVVPNDFFFELLPYNLIYEYLVDIIFVIMIILFFYYILKYAKESLAYYWIVAWMYMIFRAFINIMTPLDRPLSPDLLHGVLRLVDPSIIHNYGFIQMGMFPSGHLGFVMLAYLAVNAVAPKGASRLMLSLLFLEIFLMLASRGHYSIDILGGIVFVILIYLWSEKNIKKYLQMDLKAK